MTSSSRPARRSPQRDDHQAIALGHVGRALVDGLDVMIEQDLKFGGQGLVRGNPGAEAKASSSASR